MVKEKGILKKVLEMKKLKQILLVGLMLVSIVTGNTIHADDAELKPGEVYTKSYAKWANKSDAEKGIAQINIELYGKNKLQATDIAYVVDLSESMLTEDTLFHSPILGDYTVSELLPYQKTAWKQAREASSVFFQQMLTGEGNEENQIALVPFSSDVYNEAYANEGYNFWARHEWLYCTEKSQSIKETKSCQIGNPNTYVMKMFTVNPSFDPATDELTAFGKDFLKKYGYSENDIKKVEGKANTLPLTNDVNALENNLMSAFPYASTNYIAAMNQAENYLFSGDQAENGHRKVIVFISDGVPNNVEESIAKAEELKKRGIEFYTIGTNVTDTAKSTLSTISKDLQGKEHYIDASTETLGEAISSLSGEIKIAGTNAKISDSINTKAFHYYTDATHKPAINGVETNADEFIYDEEKEAIRWNVNDITENKKTLTYYVKLNDDVKNTDKLYETSNGIELNYTDSANQNQNVNLDIPEIKAMTGVIEKNYYLVNQDGSYIDAMGNVTSKEKAYLKTDVVVNQPIGEALDVYADETFDFEGKTYVGEKGSQQVKISWTSDGNAPVVGVDFTCTQPVKADFISEDNIFAQKNSVLGSSFGDVKTPNKEGYQFLGWYSEKDGKGTAYDSTATASGNAVYYAYHTPNRYAYSIHYYYDGIRRDEITGLQADYQTTITDFENRDGDGKYKLINQPSVVIGLDSSKNIMKVLYEINKYQVTFKNKDGNVITSMEVTHGSDATAPEAPEVKGYVFIGWDTPYTNVTSNLTVQALYEKLPEPENYLVTFIGHQGELLDTQTVQEGQDAKAPVAPEVDGYTFTGWDKAFTNVQSNLTVYAEYEINTYKVTFVNKDGKEITHMEVPYGSDAKAPNAPEVEGYTFTKWDKDYTNVKSDLTVQAVYEINKYNVRFINKDGIEITHMEVPYGSGATAPEAPEVDGYVFKNWDKDYSNVKSDLIVQAIYEKLPDPVIYKVEFIDKDGKEIETQYIKEGGNAVAPNAPKVEGYTFTNWDKDYNNVKSDLTVQAVYEINKYKVTFIDKEGKEITYVEVSYGSDATAPKAPKVEGYTFKNWDKDYKNVKSDLTIQAVYEINKYKVTFVDKDGKEITHMEVPYGSDAIAPNAPEVDGYTFTGWDKEFKNVREDLIVQALYSVNRIDPVEPVNPVTPQNPQNPQTRTPIADNNNETPYLPNTEPQEIVNQNETPKTDGKEVVKESKTPKASGDMYWALFNLLFAAGTLILGIFLLLCKLNKEEEDEDDEDKTIPYKRRKWMRVVTSIVAVAAVIIFVITEDITLTMRYTDKWTWLMAVVFLGQVIFFLAARKWKEVEEEEETKRS